MGLWDESKNALVDAMDYVELKAIESGVSNLWNGENKNIEEHWYRPKKVKRDGKTYLAKTKLFNDMKPQELQEFIGENLIPSDNPEDRHFYMLRNPRTGDVKQGTAKGSVYERYRKDHQFQNWIVDYDQPIKNANEIERIIHGNKYALKSRKFDLGDANKRGPLQSGNTEIYKQAKNPIYSGDAVIDGVVKSAVDKLRPEQRQTFDTVMDYVSKIDLKQKDYTKKETVSRDGSISSLTTGQPEDYTGAFRKDVLKRIPETYEDVVRGSELGVEKGLGGVAGLLGADTIKKAIQKKATQNVSMMHDKDGLGALVGEVLPEFFLPATTPIKAGIGLAKGIGIGASSGLAINAGYELLKEQSGIKEGQDQNALLAGGIGAVFGAIFGGVKGKDIAKMFEEGSDETKNQIIESLPEEHRQYLVDYVKANQTHEKSLAAVEAGSKDLEEEAVVAEHVVTKKKETDDEKQERLVQASRDAKEDLKEYKKRSREVAKRTKNIQERKKPKTKQKEKEIVVSSKKSNNPAIEEVKRRWEIGDVTSEDEHRTEMQKAMKGKSLDSEYKNMSSDDIDELDRMHEEELRMQAEYEKELEAEQKQTATDKPRSTLTEKKTDVPKKKKQRDKITEESIGLLEAERDYELQKAYKEDKVVDVKPMKHVSEATKSGKEVLNTEGLKKLSETEYEVTSPTKADDEGEVFSTKQVDYVTEDRQARAYEHEATLASNQGDISQKTSLKLAELKKIETEDDLKSFIDDRLKAFDIKWTLKKQYGQAQARLKATEKELSSAQIKANRIAYERDLYKKIAFNKKMPRDVRKLAHEKVKELKNKKAKEYVPSQKEKDAKEKKRTKETISKLKEDHWTRKERQFELSQRYKAQKETQGKKKTLSDEQIVSNLVKSLKDRIQEVAKLVARVEKIKGVGNKPNPADEQIIRDFLELKSDLDSYKKGEIDVDELRYRESLRLNERMSRDRKTTFESDYNVVMNAEDIKSKYAELGMNKRPQTLITEEKAKKAKERIDKAKILEQKLAYLKAKGKKIKKEVEERAIPHQLDVSLVRQNARKKAEIQLFLDGKISKEILKTRLDKIAKDDMPHRKFDKFEDEPYDRTKDSSRNTMEEIADKYVKTGYVGRNKKTGKMMLREDQVHLLDNGISPELLGRMNSKDEWIKEQAKQEAVKMLNKKFREQQGITDNFDLDKHYIFKDEMSDASASAYQITSVLLGDLELAKGVKVAGAGNKDFREVIAKELEKQIPEDTLARIREASKDYENPNGDFGKPQMKDIATTAMYGAMDESIIRDFAKKYGVTIEESEYIVNKYNDIFSKKYPSAYKMREEIYKLVPNNKGKFEWTGMYGKKSSYEAYAKVQGSLGKDRVVITNKEESDLYSRALMPNIIHSIDGDTIIETARRVDLPVGTVHDAVRGKTGSQPEILKAYTDVLVEINNSNILDEIMRELGYTGPNLKEKYGGKLTEADIKSGVNKFAVEHYEGEKIPVEKKEIDDTRFKTEHEVMDDYLASMEESKHSYNVMLDFFVDTQIYKDLYREPSEDPLKNAMYHALNSPRFTKKMAIKAPDGVDEHKFFLAQKRAHERLRRKVEFNKILSDRVLIRDGKEVPQVRGTRKYFDERGLPVGDNTPTLQAMIREERKLGQSKIKKTSKFTQKKLKKIGKNYEEIKTRVDSWKTEKKLTSIELKAKQIVDEVEAEKVGEVEKGFIRDQIEKTKHLWEEQVTSTKEIDEYNRLKAKKDVKNAQIDKDAEILYEKISKMPEETQKNARILLNSDYTAIRGMTKKQADELWSEHTAIRGICGREINQMAKAIGNTSEAYGYYLNNAKLVTERYPVLKGSEDIIDQLVSIKAMNDNNAWDIKIDSDIEYVLDVMKENHIASKEDLFANSPEKMVKGWRPEIYRGNLRPATEEELKKNPKKKFYYDAENVYEEGLIGAEMQNKKIGEKFEDEIPEFNSLEAELSFMKQHRLRKTNGEYRMVANDEYRTELGKIESLADEVTEATRSIKRKVAQQGQVYEIRDNLSDGTSTLFSKEPRKGFVQVTDAQKKHIPYELRKEFNYVNEDFTQRLLGRDEVRLYQGDEQFLKVTDRLLSNLGTMFKQNVVLKNPVSYMNSFLINQTIGMTVGIGPKSLLKHQSDAMKDIKEMKKLYEITHKRKLTGAKVDAELEKKLQNNLLFRMERAGLSTNRIEGLVGDEDLMSSMLKNNMHRWIFKTGQVLNLNQKTKVGRASLKAFSYIDTMGRYMLAKHFMETEKLSLEEAVKKSNGLYADMDKMVPESIELLDKYGFVPFLKWFSLTSPMLLKVTKENPKKALGVAVGIYLFAQETDTNMASVNPIEAMIDFAEGALPIGTIEKLKEKGFIDTMSNRANSNVVPKYLTNIYRSPETLGANKLLKHRVHYDLYKGFTQSTIERMTDDKE